MAKLSEYLADTGTTQRDFAARINVDKSTMSRLVARKFNPSLPLVNLIEEATGGQVRATDLVKDDAAHPPAHGPASTPAQGPDRKSRKGDAALQGGR